MRTIIIDLSGLQAQFNLASNQIDTLTETCINLVTTAIYSNWEALAKQQLKSTLPDYLQHLIRVDKGRFYKQIVLTGVLPNMLEQGTSAFDMKKGFKQSSKAKYTIPVYNKRGQQIHKGGDWYLTIPFRLGIPGTVGQAGFTEQMPAEVYNVIKKKTAGQALKMAEIAAPYNVPRSRAAIEQVPTNPRFDEYVHKSSIYEGLVKMTAQYEKTTQNVYGTFRRAGANSDPLSWIHRGLRAYHLAEQAIDETDVNTIVENQVTEYLESVL